LKITVIATGFEARPTALKPKIAFTSGTYATRPMTPPEPLEKISFQASRQVATPAPASPPTTPETPVEAPRSQLASHQPHVAPPQYASMMSPRPAVTPPPVAVKQATEADEDLEIPAFIRKKLM
jgi:hypothetical protein